MLLIVKISYQFMLERFLGFEGIPSEEVFQKFFATVEKLVGMAYSEETHQESFQEAINQINYKNFSEAIKILKTVRI